MTGQQIVERGSKRRRGTQRAAAAEDQKLEKFQPTILGTMGPTPKEASLNAVLEPGFATLRLSYNGPPSQQ